MGDVQSAPVVEPIKTLDFEEGNLNDWTHTGTNATAHGDAKHSGSYGMRITGNNGTPDNYSYYTFPSAMDSVYVTFYIYIPDATTFAAGAYSYQTWFYSGTSRGTLITLFGQQVTDVGGGVYKPSIWLVGETEALNVGLPATNFSRGAWHKIKMFYKKGSGADSIHRVWVDGTSVLNVTDGTRTAQVNGFLTDIYTPSCNEYIYWDDFNFYDRDPE